MLGGRERGKETEFGSWVFLCVCVKNKFGRIFGFVYGVGKEVGDVSLL